MTTLKDKIENILSDCESMDRYREVSFNGDEALSKIMDAIDEDKKLLRPELSWFAGEMEKNLKMNEFKGGWLDGRLEYYLKEGVKGLTGIWGIFGVDMQFPKTSVLSPYVNVGYWRELKDVRRKNLLYAIKKCVDCSNFMMMVAHNMIEELLKRDGKKLCQK